MQFALASADLLWETVDQPEVNVGDRQPQIEVTTPVPIRQQVGGSGSITCWARVHFCHSREWHLCSVSGLGH